LTLITLFAVAVRPYTHHNLYCFLLSLPHIVTKSTTSLDMSSALLMLVELVLEPLTCLLFVLCAQVLLLFQCQVYCAWVADAHNILSVVLL